MSEKFLSRWSRRKLEESEESAETPVSPVAETGSDDPDSMTPEEIAALPAVEGVNSAEDLMIFLRKGIPVALRMAALRKLWVLDPEIRDFVGDARDYAWDWNVPGGVPVSGPLEPGTDVDSMVRRIFGQEREGPASPSNASVRENVIERGTPQNPPRIADRRQEPQETSSSPAEPGELSISLDDEIPRRHGGALPA
jgi:hypothetical protein